jgi:hypothetical protein
VLSAGRTLDTNMDVVLLTLLDLAGVFIRFREGIDGFEVLLALGGDTGLSWELLRTSIDIRELFPAR